MRRRACLTLILGFLLAGAFGTGHGLRAQQVPDSAYAPPVPWPAFPEGEGPVVLIDEAHFNFHTAGGRYLAFANLLRRDGYLVNGSSAQFTPETLGKGDILVISNALAEEQVSEWALPAVSAFDILFNNGFAMHERDRVGRITFRRSDGTLVDHPVTRGREVAETVDSVVTFTGQAFRGVGEVEPLLVLSGDIALLMPVTAWEFSDQTPRLSAEGMLQGAVLRFGAGRVAVFGEAAMFSAQLAGDERVPMGMNAPVAAQNHQFLLNVVHWLSGLLE